MSAQRNRCIICKLPRDTGRPISKRGLCPKCAKERMDENTTAMIDKQGPSFDKWKEHWNTTPKFP